MERQQIRRAVIDARIVGPGSGGIVTYARELCAALARIPSEFSLVLMHAPGAPLDNVAGVEQCRALTPSHHRWEHVTFGLELLSHRPALVHAVDFVAPFLRTCPAVMTVHDVAFLFWPEIHDRDGRAHYGQLHQALDNAEAIIAVSETTRFDLCTYLGVEPDRVTVVPEAASPVFQPVPEAQRATRLQAAQARREVVELVLGRCGAYFLVVGTIEPRKNLPMLLRAYDRLVARWPAAPRLVLAGRRGWLADDTFAMLGCLQASERVDWIDSPSTDELVLLYAGAVALAFPSRYEGVGLPALEAMACGTPVLAADTSGLREHVAQAGWLLPITDEAAWSEAMYRVATDEELQVRLATAGQQRVVRYSWARSAALTLDVYRRVVGNA